MLSLFPTECCTRWFSLRDRLPIATRPPCARSARSIAVRRQPTACARAICVRDCSGLLLRHSRPSPPGEFRGSHLGAPPVSLVRATISSIIHKGALPACVRPFAAALNNIFVRRHGLQQRPGGITRGSPAAIHGCDGCCHSWGTAAPVRPRTIGVRRRRRHQCRRGVLSSRPCRCTARCSRGSGQPTGWPCPARRAPPSPALPQPARGLPAHTSAHCGAAAGRCAEPPAGRGSAATGRGPGGNCPPPQRRGLAATAGARAALAAEPAARSAGGAAGCTGTTPGRRLRLDLVDQPPQRGGAVVCACAPLHVQGGDPPGPPKPLQGWRPVGPHCASVPGYAACGLHLGDGRPRHWLASWRALRGPRRMRGPPSARAERSAPPHVHRAGVAGRPAGRACRGGGGCPRFSGAGRGPSAEPSPFFGGPFLVCGRDAQPHPRAAASPAAATAATGRRRCWWRRCPGPTCFGRSASRSGAACPTTAGHAVGAPAASAGGTASHISRGATCLCGAARPKLAGGRLCPPARGGHTRDRRWQGGWGLASTRPALRLLRGRPARADAGGGPRQGRRNSSDLAPGRRSVRGHLGPTRGPRQLLRPGASPGCGLRAQHIGPLWGSVALSGSARARRLAVRDTRGSRPVPTGARPPLAMAARARGRRRRRRHGRTRGGRRRGRGGGSAPPPRETTRPCRPSASLSVSIPRC